NAQLTSAAFSAKRTVGVLDMASWDVYRGTNFPATFLAHVTLPVPANNNAILAPILPLGPGQYLFIGKAFDELGSGQALANYTFTFQVSGAGAPPGQTSIVPGNQISIASGALLTLQADGSFRYDPNGNFKTLGDGQTA